MSRPTRLPSLPFGSYHPPNILRWPPAATATPQQADHFHSAPRLALLPWQSVVSENRQWESRFCWLASIQRGFALLFKLQKCQQGRMKPDPNDIRRVLGLLACVIVATVFERRGVDDYISVPFHHPSMLSLCCGGIRPNLGMRQEIPRLFRFRVESCRVVVRLAVSVQILAIHRKVQGHRALCDVGWQWPRTARVHKGWAGQVRQQRKDKWRTWTGLTIVNFLRIVDYGHCLRICESGLALSRLQAGLFCEHEQTSLCRTMQAESGASRAQGRMTHPGTRRRSWMCPHRLAVRRCVDDWCSPHISVPRGISCRVGLPARVCRTLAALAKPKSQRLVGLAPVDDARRRLTHRAFNASSRRRALRHRGQLGRTLECDEERRQETRRSYSGNPSVMRTRWYRNL